jgi:hypothetical protein
MEFAHIVRGRANKDVNNRTTRFIDIFLLPRAGG